MSYLIYGGQPRKVLQQSADVTSEEKESMLTWSSRLKQFGEYDEFVSSGGISWVDVPLPTGRRLFLRVFATQGEARDSWYFLGVFLADTDYDAIGAYGKLVRFVESVDIKDLLSNRAYGPKFFGSFEFDDDQLDVMPPLFDNDRFGREWTKSPWITNGDVRLQQREGGPFHIAFNPPKARDEYTAILIGEGFPFPGLRIKPTPMPEIARENESEKKKPASIRPSHLTLLALLIPAFLAGFFLKPGGTLQESFAPIQVTLAGEKRVSPEIQLPRNPNCSFTLKIPKEYGSVETLSVSSSDGAVKVEAPVDLNAVAVQFPCSIDLNDSRDANAEQHISLTIEASDKVVDILSFVIQSADISVGSLRRRDVVAKTIDERFVIQGLALARYGIDTVTVNGVEAKIEVTNDRRSSRWEVDLPAYTEELRIVSEDVFGNRVSSFYETP